MFELATKFKPDEPAPFEIAVAAGYRCAELWTGPDVLEALPRTKELTLAFSLRYALHFPTRRDLTAEHLANVVDLYRTLRCRSMTIHQLEYDRYAAELLALDAGLVLAVENGALSPAEFARWGASNRYLTLDAEHLWMFTNEGATCAAAAAAVESLLREHGSKLRHVHLPGNSGGPAEHQPMVAGREYVCAVLDRLAVIGYEGFVVSEVEQKFQTVGDLTKDRQLFDEWLESHRQAQQAQQ